MANKSPIDKEPNFREFRHLGPKTAQKSHSPVPGHLPDGPVD